MTPDPRAPNLTDAGAAEMSRLLALLKAAVPDHDARQRIVWAIIDYGGARQTAGIDFMSDRWERCNAVTFPKLTEAAAERAPGLGQGMG